MAPPSSCPRIHAEKGAGASWFAALRSPGLRREAGMKLRGGASEEEERGGGLGGMGADWKAMEELRSVQCKLVFCCILVARGS